jgi:hypothetical protein
VSLVVAILFVLVALAVVGAVVVARSNRTSFAKSNEVVPGTPTRAPASWAGDHTPEARLHRRLRDAVAALPPRDDLGRFEARAALEQKALDVDEQLIAVAALPERVRGDQLALVEAAVDAVEAGVAAVTASSAGALEPAKIDDALAAITERVKLVAEARTELGG